MRANGKVDFLVVGTQKGGTTALASFLRQHPQIFIPEIKEAHFFDFEREYLDPSTGSPRYGAYHQLYDDAQPHQLWGEATPIYMFLPFVASRIHAYNPAMKLIFLLRDPVKRAYSHYKMVREREWERWPFALAAAIEFFRVRFVSGDSDERKDPIRINTYLSRGFYSWQIRRFVRLFPIENCLFVKSEDLLGRHDCVMRRIFGFLGVDSELKVPAARVFVGERGNLNPLLARVLGLLYRRERRRLEQLTGLKFSDWS